MTPVNATVDIYQNIQFRASALMFNRSLRDVTEEVQWESADPSVAALLAPGLFKGLNPFPTRVTGRLGPHTFQTDLQVVSRGVPGPIPNPFAENFDGVTAPALPAGWTGTATGVANPPVTSTTASNTTPNSVFMEDQGTVTDVRLTSPTFSVPAGGATLSFDLRYSLESMWDGMVLEISVNGGAFGDITAGGNAFLAGGYTRGGICLAPAHGKRPPPKGIHRP